MARARCPFYRPKDSLTEQLVEGNANLVRMPECVRLPEEEWQLVEEGIRLHQMLIEKPRDAPTPAGPSLREWEARRQDAAVLIPVSAIQAKTSRPPPSPGI
jgi:hypothetical protein